MKRLVISLAVGAAVFVGWVVVEIAVGAFLAARATRLDAAGFPVPQTPEEAAAQASNLGAGLLLGLVIAVVAAAVMYWRRRASREPSAPAR